jgi:hypothetical protein
MKKIKIFLISIAFVAIAGVSAYNTTLNIRKINQAVLNLANIMTLANAESPACESKVIVLENGSLAILICNQSTTQEAADEGIYCSVPASTNCVILIAFE